MPIALILVVVVALLAVRYPIVNTLTGWFVVFPILTIAGGTIAWTLLIQRWDSLFSLEGLALTLGLVALPVAFWVMRLNST